MATEILMPKLGLTMTEGTIDEWKKKVGDTVNLEGDIVGKYIAKQGRAQTPQGRLTEDALAAAGFV